VELNEPPVTATGRMRARTRRAAALVVAIAILGTGWASTAYAATPTPGASQVVHARQTPPAPRAPANPPAAHRPAAHRPAARRPAAHRPAAHRPPAVRRPRTGPDASGRCPTNLGRIACVDLTHQLMWVQVGSRVVFGPVPVRTGRAGYVTRTGLWHIYLRNEDQWSSLYSVAMPYSQFFSGGEAFHGLNGESMSTPPGSHGCVNMNTWDARRLWGILKDGDPVEVFGRKPGT